MYPRTYTIEQYGYHPNEVAFSFDDGPDPKWTPKILDILKQKNVKGTFLIDRRRSSRACGRDAADVPRGPRDWQSHVDASGHQRNLGAPTGPGGEADGPAVREQAGGAAALLPAAVRHRRGAGHRRPGRAGGEHSARRLHDYRQQDRYRRLERASAQDADGDCAIGAGAVADDEDEAAVSRLDHPDARRRRQSAGDGGCACRC